MERTRTRTGVAVVVLTVAALSGLSLPAAAAPTRFSDKAQFLAQTGAASATGPLPNSGSVGDHVTLGSVMLDARANPDCPGCSINVGPDWTPLLPGNDIAIDGTESLDFVPTGPVYALGFDFVEPSSSGGCGTICVESSFSVTVKQGATVVDSFTFDPPNDTAAFVGVSSDVAFDKVEVREMIGTNDNEFYGQVYTSSAKPGGPGDVRPTTPAPVVTDVGPARPIARGAATILTAGVDGNADRLEWNLRGDAKPEVVSAAGATGVRFRPRPGLNVVSVRAVGPSGAGPFVTKTIVGPPPLAGLLGRVEKKIQRKPGADAAGPIGQLLLPPSTFGNVGCLGRATTIRTGTLTISGTLAPVDSVADIPAAERGILDQVARKLGVASNLDALGSALKLSDAYVSRCFLDVNGVSLEPGPDGAIVVFPQLNAIASSDAALKIGKLALANKRDFVMSTLANAGGQIDLGSFPRLPTSALKALGKFSFVGDVDVKLLPASGAIPGAAQITAKLQLPPVFKTSGVGAEGKVVLRATAAEGLILDHARVGPINAQLGGLGIEGLQLDYRRINSRIEEWTGQAKACIPAGFCLNMAEPNGRVRFVNGELESAGASLDFHPGIPVYPSVALTRIGFLIGQNPTRFVGDAQLTVMKLLTLDGHVVMAFPSERAPFILDRGEVGGAFPPHFYGQRYTRPTFGIGAEAFLKVPVIGDIKLAGAYVLYEYPGYVAFGGGIDADIVVVSLSGRVDGEINFANGRFRIGGTVEVCVADIACAQATAVVSSHGAGACVDTGLTMVGGGVVYSPFDVYIWLLDGCRWSTFEEKNVRGAQAGAAQTIQIKSGDPSREIELRGTDGAPRIRVSGPDGQSVDSPSGPGLARRGSLRVARSERHKLTIVGLQDPKPGTYRIEPLPGSPTVSRVREAEDQPAAKATVQVLGRGAKRTLAYDVRRRDHQTVTFTEIDAGGATRSIGTVSGGGRGTLRFSPAPGRGSRRIEAQFELAGLPAERLTVARFNPPSPNLARPGRLRVRRAGTSLHVAWASVPDAARYEIAITGSGGPQKLARTRGRRITVRGIARSSRGRVSVRAVAPLRVGPVTSARFRATSPRKNRLGPLPRCRGKTRLVCA